MAFKPVVILAEDLPAGLQANFSVVLGMSLGRLCPDVVGEDTPTRDGTVIPGITTVAVPVLAAPADALADLFNSAEALPVRLAYMRAAWEARDYADYRARMVLAPLADHVAQALLLAGPRKAVDRLCGRLPLLR